MSDLTLSFEPQAKAKIDLALLEPCLSTFMVDLRVESEADFIASMANYQRIRYLSPTSASAAELKQAASDYVAVVKHRPYQRGRIELIYYLQEQSISHDYHRYGNLGLKGSKLPEN